MKCDEVKPTCGPCAKKEKICDFSNPTQNTTSSPQVTSSAVPEALPAVPSAQTLPPEQSSDHTPRGPNQDPVHYEPHETSDHAWTAPETNANPLIPALLEYPLGNDAIPEDRPVALYEDYLPPSTAALAAVRWFGLLASGFPGGDQQLSIAPNFWDDGSLSLGHFNDDGNPQVSSLQRATQVLDSPGSAASHDMTNGDATENNALTEEHIWQSRQPIELLPEEQVLFKHFVNQVGPWVGHRIYIRD